VSRRALCLAVKDALQSKFGWGDDQCDVTEEGQPVSGAGELFVGVTEGGYRCGTQNSLDELHGVDVVISRRGPFSPHDRHGRTVINDVALGLEVLADQIKALVHANETLRAKANDYVQESVSAAGSVPGSIYGFCLPLWFKGVSRPQYRDGAWFHSEQPERYAGLSVTVSFDGAERLQSIADQS